MKLKITKILEVKDPWKPEGKNYTLYQWVVSGMLDGQLATPILLKSFKQIPVNVDQEMEVEKQVYQDKTSYMIKDQKTGGKKWNSKPSYTKTEYNELFKYSLMKCGVDINSLNEDNRCKIFATYFIGAKDSGVKIESQPKQENKSNIEPFNPNESIEDDNDDGGQIPF